MKDVAKGLEENWKEVNGQLWKGLTIRKGSFDDWKELMEDSDIVDIPQRASSDGEDYPYTYIYIGLPVCVCVHVCMYYSVCIHNNRNMRTF